MLPRALPTVVLLGSTVLLADAPQQEAPRPAFEVASVRPSPPGRTMRETLAVGVGYRGETLTLPGQTLSQLIGYAYGVGTLSPRPFATIEGLPAWREDRFDIVARTAGPVPLTSYDTLGPLNYMVQSLLEERFHLVVRWETRERPVYALVLARDDGALGPQIRPSTVDCDAHRAAASAPRAAGPPPAPRLPPVPGQLEQRERPVCGIVSSNGIIAGHEVPHTREVLIGTRSIADLAAVLGLDRSVLDRPVVDRTGLTGSFDMELRYAVPRPPMADPSDVPDPGWPVVADALRDQLGLRLETTRGPVDVLVIVSVHPPTEN